MSAANIAPSQGLPNLDTIREVYPRTPDLRPPQPQTIPNANDPADPSSRSLLTILSQFWGYSATNPKKVYALLNMVDSHKVQVDYETNIAELFKEVAFHIIVQSRNLGLLTIINYVRQTKNRLPSWTPDWADFNSNSMPLQLHQGYNTNSFKRTYMRRYTAGGQLVITDPIRRGDILSLPGYLIDKLENVGPKMPSVAPEQLSRCKWLFPAVSV